MKKKTNRTYPNIFRWLCGGVGKSTTLIVVLLLVFIPLAFLVTTFFTTPRIIFASHSRVGLGTVDNFAVLAGSAITDTGTSTIKGDVGLSPTGGATIIGLTCAEVTGTIYDTNGGYTGGGGASTACRITDAGLLTTAKDDLTTAYNDAAGRSTTSTVATELGSTTLTDGTYDSAAGTFEITGTLTLDGGGNANSVFIFKMSTTLVTASSSQVLLTNGAQACNVYWKVGSSATLGTSTSLVGNVLAFTSITDNGSSTVNGRLLARTGAVTLNNTTVIRALCAAGTTGAGITTLAVSTPTPGPSSGSSSSSSSGGSCPILNYNAPIILEQNRIDADSIFISWGPNLGINTFDVRYGPEDGKWLYHSKVTGYSTTINGLSPGNWFFQVAAEDNCSIGKYSGTRLAGGLSLPNTGLKSHESSIPWYISNGIVVFISALVLIKKKQKLLSTRWFKH